MEIIDLSHTLEPGMQVYPGDPAFSSAPFASIPSDGYAVCALSLGSHTGTHVDAPAHFFASGPTIEEIPLDAFIGRAVVVDLTHKGAREKITWAGDLARHAPRMGKGVILLLHTGWSRWWGTDAYVEHPFLEREAAERIIATGVRVLGVDTLSPDETHLDGAGTEGGSGFAAHKVILGAGGLIAENLANLHALSADVDYVVHLVPLKIAACDASPVRAYAYASKNIYNEHTDTITR